MVILRRDPEIIEQLRGGYLGLASRRSLAPWHEQRGRETGRVIPDDGRNGILQDGQFAEKRVLLERPAKAAAREIERWDIRYVYIVEEYLTATIDCVGDGRKAAALSRTVWTDNAENLVSEGRPTDVVQCNECAVLDGEIFHAQDFPSVRTLVLLYAHD